jgi:hypothetical protein
VRSQKSTRVLDVLPGIGRVRFDEDRVGWYFEPDRFLAVMDGLASWESIDGCRSVGAGEDQARVHALVVQVGRVDSHARVVAAESNADIARPDLVMHVVVVPEHLDIGPKTASQHGARGHQVPLSPSTG